MADMKHIDKDELKRGIAERAGAAAAKLGEDARKAAPVIDDAVQKGAFGLGRMLSNTKGMFRNFKDEFDKGLHGDE